MSARLGPPAGDDRPGLSRLAGLCLGVLSLAAAAFFAFQALARFFTFHNRTFDLALYTRWAWGMARGDWGWNPILDQAFVSSHWSFVLLPLGWLGMLLGTAETLLIAQALAFGLTAWPLAQLAARRGGDVLGLATGLAFLLYPNTCHVASYEFHPGNLALPALAWGIDAVDRGAARRLLWSVLFVLLCRADFALATGMLGVLAWARGGALAKPGRGVVFASIGYLLLVQAARALWGGPQASADLHFGPWGGSPLGVVEALFTRPSAVWDHFSAPAKLSYPLRVLAPLAALPLLRPRYALVALPFLALNMISVFPTTPELYSHYLTPAVPGLVAAAGEGVAALGTRGRVVGSGLLMAAGVAGSVLWGGAPWSRDFVAGDYRFDQGSWGASWALEAIPAGVSVQAPDALLPHVAERPVVHRAPPPERGTDVVVLDASHRQRYFGRETVLRTSEEPLVRTWMARPDHAVVEATPQMIVLARGGDPRRGFARRYLARERDPGDGGIPLTPCLTVLQARLVKGSALRLRLAVRARCPADLALRLGTRARPRHVRLMFDGFFSTAHVRLGDVLTLTYGLPEALAGRIADRGRLRIGALRTSGAPPVPGDPVTVEVPLTR